MKCANIAIEQTTSPPFKGHAAEPWFIVNAKQINGIK